jgi:hypothetical protein
VSEAETARRLLASLGVAIAHAKSLMESESEEVRVFALDVFTRLAEMELALLTALGLDARSREENPLVRRLRRDG